MVMVAFLRQPDLGLEPQNLLTILAHLAVHVGAAVEDLGNPLGALRAIARSQKAVVREITPWLLILSRS